MTSQRKLRLKKETLRSLSGRTLTAKGALQILDKKNLGLAKGGAWIAITAFNWVCAEFPVTDDSVKEPTDYYRGSAIATIATAASFAASAAATSTVATLHASQAVTIAKASAYGASATAGVTGLLG